MNMLIQRLKSKTYWVALIIVPADCGLTIEEIAAKDVPAGTPYSIVDAADIPTDRIFRNAWELT